MVVLLVMVVSSGDGSIVSVDSDDGGSGVVARGVVKVVILVHNSSIDGVVGLEVGSSVDISTGSDV